uniref:AMP-binding domain-containing protein n=1 Tax=Angiostrongylus cantonensis TaxID=6313 RepID=A0A0K0D448_ANGCA
LRRFIEDKFGVKIGRFLFQSFHFFAALCIDVQRFSDSYLSFHRWSCENYAKFWEALLFFTGIKLGSSYDTVVDTSMRITDFPRWFSGATLNYAENCLRGKDEDCLSICSTSFSNSGITPADVICGFLPNSYQTSVAMFATAAIGATWCSVSVDFGPCGVVDRFKQVNPKVLFTVEAVTYKGKTHDLTEKLNLIVPDKELENNEIAGIVMMTTKYKCLGIPSLAKVVQINNLNSTIDFNKYQHGEKYESFDYFLNSVPFSHPLFVMFSSGTTGIPKAMIHTTGVQLFKFIMWSIFFSWKINVIIKGTLLKHVEEHLIQANSQSCDRILFYTTCGWMMWNWVMSFLFCGGSIVLFDESPLEPDPHIILKVASVSNATIIGMGAKMYDEYSKMNVDFRKLYKVYKLQKHL